jgi:quercetin dioxygenase-like cupin family protein
MEVTPKHASVTGPTEWFTGDVVLDPIVVPQDGSRLTVSAVHFSPGARTAWHAHTLGQVLYVTEGEGRVQSRGAHVVTIRPGDVVRTPADEWHWHGAAAAHFMTHLSMTEGNAVWGDHVSDDEYGG